MHKGYIKIVAFTISILIGTIACAQSIHFSQFTHTPLLTNPANTGFIPDGDYRISAHYRTQYSAVMNVPYTTFAVFGDTRTLESEDQNGWLGIGASLMRDVAGSSALSTTKLYGSVAYHQILGASSLLSGGITAGWASKRINRSKLKFPDQFDGRFFDSNLPTNVVLDNTAINYLDIQLGLNYAYFPNEQTYVNGGISIQHVNNPKETFFQSTTVDPATGYPYNQTIPMQYNFFINGSFKTNSDWIVNPNIHYSRTTGASALALGCTVQYNLSDNGGHQLIGGLYYRLNDAVIPMIGLNIQGFAFTFSYDATVSALTKFNHTYGALELSLVKVGVFSSADRQKHKPLICPRF